MIFKALTKPPRATTLSHTNALHVCSHAGSAQRTHTRARTIKWHACFKAGGMQWHGHGRRRTQKYMRFPCSLTQGMFPHYTHVHAFPMHMLNTWHCSVVDFTFSLNNYHYYLKKQQLWHFREDINKKNVLGSMQYWPFIMDAHFPLHTRTKCRPFRH